MRFKFSFTAAIVTVAASLLTAPAYANADSYQILDLGPSAKLGRVIYGIDTAGDVVVEDFEGCAANRSGFCYEIWVDGVNTATNLVTPPSLAYDNGTSCIPAGLPAGVVAIDSYCNNGREAFFATFVTPPVTGLFTGPDPVADLFYSGGVAQVFLNAGGDFAWQGGVIVGPLRFRLSRSLRLSI